MAGGLFDCLFSFYFCITGSPGAEHPEKNNIASAGFFTLPKHAGQNIRSEKSCIGNILLFGPLFQDDPHAGGVLLDTVLIGPCDRCDASGVGVFHASAAALSCLA